MSPSEVTGSWRQEWEPHPWSRRRTVKLLPQVERTLSCLMLQWPQLWTEQATCLGTLKGGLLLYVTAF